VEAFVACCNISCLAWVVWGCWRRDVGLDAGTCRHEDGSDFVLKPELSAKVGGNHSCSIELQILCVQDVCWLPKALRQSHLPATTQHLARCARSLLAAAGQDIQSAIHPSFVKCKQRAAANSTAHQSYLGSSQQANGSRRRPEGLLTFKQPHPSAAWTVQSPILLSMYHHRHMIPKEQHPSNPHHAEL
jgi:hypothetical protein